MMERSFFLCSLGGGTRRRTSTIALLLVSCYVALWLSSTMLLTSRLHELQVSNKPPNPNQHQTANAVILIPQSSSSSQAKSELKTSTENEKSQRPILTAYIQKKSIHTSTTATASNRIRSVENELEMHEYPQAYMFLKNEEILDHANHHHQQQQQQQQHQIVHPFPIIDEYPNGDSFLPWIHDLHPSSDGTSIQFYAQNRRRCHTGDGNEDIMRQQEGQIALFQPIALAFDNMTDDNTNEDKNNDNSHETIKDMNVDRNESYPQQQQKHKHRVSSYEDADPQTKETRFICRFKDVVRKVSWTTFSTYPFNYEYISKRKQMNTMFERSGKEMGQFWLSSLVFNCPIPNEIQKNDGGIHTYTNALYLDLIPIRTPVRYGEEQFFFHEGHAGYKSFDVDKEWGEDLYVPPIEKSTRWENIYINTQFMFPWEEKKETKNNNKHMEVVDTQDEIITAMGKNIGVRKKPFHLVACTWASVSHNRRGDAATISGGKERLQEWIAFHLLVGYDHIVVYDNSGANTNVTSLKGVTDQFGSDQVTYVSWPCKICNNNRPAHADPGERSSQYAAEASCRGRFAPYTEWMSFMDPDEYFVPMGKFNSWKEILPLADKEGKKVLKFRSSRARALPEMMKPIYGPQEQNCPTLDEVNGDDLRKASCLVRSEEHTFLETYNCEYIKSPKPDRFQRAMKQIYRPDYVLSHFVHYSTVTTDLAQTKDQAEPGKFVKYSRTSNPNTERFIDEINEGILVHAKSIVPEEAVLRDARCKYKLHPGCNVGIPCPDDLAFDDKMHQDGFLDKAGGFCNCWMNRKVDKVWIPLLEKSLEQLRKK